MRSRWPGRQAVDHAIALHDREGEIRALLGLGLVETAVIFDSIPDLSHELRTSILSARALRRE
ncbi:hypothetical protein [Kibdelosporangium aridum]|uniref:hypothetical protein n=1 Tax=Kibdelosporangium aridum TaxID=2030 RepID=UPI000F76D626|nr:hypothetical protein [Kibdelosporangium aridum]